MSEAPDHSGEGCEFDWSTHAAEHLVVPEQNAIAIYTSAGGHIIIRQADALPAYGHDDDAVVVIAPHYVPRVIAALQAMVGLSDRGPTPLASEPDRGATPLPPEPDRVVPVSPPTAPLSNAQRQKRYRQQHRNENRNARNGKRNAPVTQDAELFTSRKGETTP